MSQQPYQVIVPDTDFYRQMVKCQAACPVNTDARGYVTAIGCGDLERGYRIAREPNPLASMCGQVCGAPCEAACRRGSVDAPVAIRPLKRVLTQRYGPESKQHLPPARPLPVLGDAAALDDSSAAWTRSNLRKLAATPGRRTGKVAVVGAGPASLATAHDLAILGHQVTIYEAGEKSGGMIRYGVPSYRMDWNVLDREVQAIADLGVEFRYRMPVGDKVLLTDLRRDHDAVFLGAGLMRGRGLNIEGNALDGVVKAVDLLLNFNMGYELKLGQHVVVIGGGDVAMDAARTALRAAQRIAEQNATAMTAQPSVNDEADRDNEPLHDALDVARTALRLGAIDVKLIAMESWDELPASDTEVEEAGEEGVAITTRIGPKRILGQDGKVVGLETVEVESVFGPDGKFAPKFKEGSEKVIDCDTVILAIGQSADLKLLEGCPDITVSPRGILVTDPATGATAAPDVFAGGDVAHGPRLLISAVRDGHLAALSIDAKIQQHAMKKTVTATWKDIPHHSMPEHWIDYQRTRVPSLPVEQRTGITQVEVGFGVDEATVQGLRCLECSINTVFDGGKCILCNGCVDVCPWDCLKIVNLDDVSGSETVQKVVAAHLGATGDDRFSMAAMIKNDTACTRCGLCAQRCPTGAVTMESFRFKEELSYVQDAT